MISGAHVEKHDGEWIVVVHLDPDDADWIADCIGPTDGASDDLHRAADDARRRNGD